MCDFIEWFLKGRLTEWLSAIGALISGYIAYKVFLLDEKVSEGAKPRVSIWFDNSYQTFDGILGELTFINLGKESLPIRTLTFLYGNPENRIHSALSDSLLNSTQINNSANFSNSKNDLIFKNNQIIKYTLLSESDWPNQFSIRAMYYDNTFEFIQIDTSNLGGKYILTGKGKK